MSPSLPVRYAVKTCFVNLNGKIFHSTIRFEQREKLDQLRIEMDLLVKIQAKMVCSNTSVLELWNGQVDVALPLIPAPMCRDCRHRSGPIFQIMGLVMGERNAPSPQITCVYLSLIPRNHDYAMINGFKPLHSSNFPPLHFQAIQIRTTML